MVSEDYSSSHTNPKPCSSSQRAGCAPIAVFEYYRVLYISETPTRSPGGGRAYDSIDDYVPDGSRCLRMTISTSICHLCFKAPKILNTELISDTKAPGTPAADPQHSTSPGIPVSKRFRVWFKSRVEGLVAEV